MSKFIVIEGSEGVGKSSQIQTIQTYLEERKIKYVLTREPGGTELGESIRTIILDEKNNTDDISDSLLFYAARYENFKKIIIPALERDCVVISDRFHYSTLVYQGIVGNNAIVKKIHYAFDEIFSNIINHIIYFYTTPEISFERISKRSKTDKFESRGIEYLKDILQGYESVFSDIDNVIKIDTSMNKNITKKNLITHLDKIFS